MPTFECNFNQLHKMGGTGDGAKWMCGKFDKMFSGLFNEGKKAIAYSLGSNGQFEFERAVKAELRDRVDVHSMDCTGTWKDASTTFHKICIGKPPSTDLNMYNRGAVTADMYKDLHEVAQELNHTYVSILKFDIEGFEWSLFDSLLTPQNSALLPVVMFVELHTHLMSNLDSYLPPSYLKQRNWVRPLLELSRKLDAYGYVLVAKERNEWDPRQSKCCTEYLFLRIRSLQGVNLEELGGFGESWAGEKLGIDEKFPG